MPCLRPPVLGGAGDGEAVDGDIDHAGAASQVLEHATYERGRSRARGFQELEHEGGGGQHADTPLPGSGVDHIDERQQRAPEVAGGGEVGAGGGAQRNRSALTAG